MGTQRLIGKLDITSKIVGFVFVFMLFFACNPQKDPVVSINAAPEQIPYSGNTVISWQSSNADYCMLNGTKVDPSGSLSKTLTETTKYTIVAFSGESTANAEVTVAVGSAPAPTITVTAPKEQLSYGTSTTFSWIAAGFINAITLDGKAVQNTGSFTTPVLYGNAEYVLLASGPGGSTTQKVQIAVYVPTRTDSICSKSLHLIAMETLDKNGNLLSSADLTDAELSNVFYFYKDGTLKGFRKDGSLLSSGAWKWSGSNKVILGGVSGGDEYTYALTNTTFITYRTWNDTILKVTYKRI